MRRSYDKEKRRNERKREEKKREGMTNLAGLQERVAVVLALLDGVFEHEDLFLCVIEFARCDRLRLLDVSHLVVTILRLAPFRHRRHLQVFQLRFQILQLLNILSCTTEHGDLYSGMGSKKKWHKY